MQKTSEQLRAQAEELKLTIAAAQDEQRKLQDAIRQAKTADRAAKSKAEADASYAECLAIAKDASLNEGQHSKIYAIAYEHGHSSGYHEVSQMYDTLAELAREVLKAQ